MSATYDLSGGPVGWLVERLVASIVGRNLLATLLAARRILEFESGEPLGRLPDLPLV